MDTYKNKYHSMPPPVDLRLVTLFLEKLEKMTDKERAVLITTIEMLNHPMFVTN